MKATEQYFPVVLFIMLYKVVLTFESVNKVLWCVQLKESASKVLFHDAICFLGHYTIKCWTFVFFIHVCVCCENGRLVTQELASCNKGEKSWIYIITSSRFLRFSAAFFSIGSKPSWPCLIKTLSVLSLERIRTLITCKVTTSQWALWWIKCWTID